MALRAVIDHPKFCDLKARLGLTKYQTLGLLEALWHFTGRYTPQGNIGRYSDQQIEAWLEWNGEPGEAIAALIETRWLDAEHVHRLLVHDWPEHADHSTKVSLKRQNLTFIEIRANGVQSECEQSANRVRTECEQSANPVQTVFAPPVPGPGAGPEAGPVPVPGGPRARPREDAAQTAPTAAPNRTLPENKSLSDLEKQSRQRLCPPEDIELGDWKRACDCADQIERVKTSVREVRGYGGVIRARALCSLAEFSESHGKPSWDWIEPTINAMIVQAPTNPDLMKILEDLQKFPDGAYPDTSQGARGPCRLERAHRIVSKSSGHRGRRTLTQLAGGTP